MVFNYSYRISLEDCGRENKATNRAILTHANRHWTVFQLYDELHREHCAMAGKEQDDSK